MRPNERLTNLSRSHEFALVQIPTYEKKIVFGQSQKVFDFRARVRVNREKNNLGSRIRRVRSR